jgi:AraC-like DNA-binding protein
MHNEEEILKRALQFIVENLSNKNLTVFMTAEAANTNVNELYEIFCNYINICAKRCILMLRIEGVEKEIITLYQKNDCVKSASVVIKYGFSGMSGMNNSIKLVEGVTFIGFKKKVIQNYLAGNPSLINTEVIRKYL